MRVRNEVNINEQNGRDKKLESERREPKCLGLLQQIGLFFFKKSSEHKSVRPTQSHLFSGLADGLKPLNEDTETTRKSWERVESWLLIRRVAEAKLSPQRILVPVGRDQCRQPSAPLKNPH